MFMVEVEDVDAQLIGAATINQNYTNSIKETEEFSNHTTVIIINIKRFITISSPTNGDPRLINYIKGNQDLEKQLGGEPKSVTELEYCKLLIVIEVANEQQSNRIKDIKSLNNTNIMASEHKTLNSSKGTIKY